MQIYPKVLSLRGRVQTRSVCLCVCSSRDVSDAESRVLFSLFVGDTYLCLSAHASHSSLFSLPVLYTIRNVRTVKSGNMNVSTLKPFWMHAWLLLEISLVLTFCMEAYLYFLEDRDLIRKKTTCFIRFRNRRIRTALSKFFMGWKHFSLY